MIYSSKNLYSTTDSDVRNEKERIRKYVKKEQKVYFNTLNCLLSHQTEFWLSGNQLMRTPMFKYARMVFVFHPMQSEPDIRRLVPAMKATKKLVMIPLPDRIPLFVCDISRHSIQCRTIAYRKANGSISRLYIPLSKKRTQFWRIPLNMIFQRMYCHRNPIVMLVPGMAFSLAGKRLGRGGGFYDRFIRYMKRNANGAKLYVVGVCRESNIIDIIPTHNHDMPVDILLTERQLIRIKTK